MRALRRRESCGGWSLVENLVAMSLIGGLVVSVLPVSIQVVRESTRASREAEVLASRWETVRRFRFDVSRAGEARVLGAADGEPAGVELRAAFSSVTWAEHDGLLHRAASPGPVVQGVPATASFGVEKRRGRVFVNYELTDEVGTVTGSVLVGSAP